MNIPTPAHMAMLFAVTWVIGLSMPVVVRFAILRRPLSRQASNGIAFAWSAFWWLFFFFASSQARTGQVYHGTVWLLLFFVNRWLLNRGRGDAPVRGSRDESQGTKASILTKKEMVSGLERILASPDATPGQKRQAAERLAKLKP